ncbi:uncharacterized protein LOC141537860 isoform X2 [Cotesia typhae]|uniref:uncharacterized protein LOC141537860 isoform X2 n=1 Tax=Cotesia typhae TaxID=2053667 RepID=UPI003D697B7C
MNEIVRILIIALIAIANAQAMKNLRVGDTVNLSKNDSGEVIVSDIFNGFNGSRFIKKQHNDEYDYEFSYQTCLRFESLEAHFYPQVFIGEKQSKRTSEVLFYHLLLQRNEYLGVNRNYVNDRYFRYGIVKICMAIDVHSLNIKLIDDDDFLEVANDGLYGIWINETVVFRLKRDNETHYASSISTGNCLLQISINDAIKCNNIDPNVPDQAANFFSTSIYRSSITFADVNHQLEEKINEYYFLNNLDYSLFTFPNAERVHQNKILSNFQNKVVVKLILRPLPKLPELSESQKQHISLTNLKEMNYIAPGDGFNLNKLFTSRWGRVTTKNLLMSTNNEFTSAFTTYSYSRCRKYTKNETLEIDNGKLNVFEESLNHQNYGIGSEKFDPKKMCLKLTACSGFKNQKLEFPSAVVIKLNKNSKNNIKYNIFEGKNIILWFSKGDETHFTTGTEKDVDITL